MCFTKPGVKLLPKRREKRFILGCVPHAAAGLSAGCAAAAATSPPCRASAGTDGCQGAETPSPAPRLQDLLWEKEISPAACTKDSSAPRIPSPHLKPCPGSAHPLPSRPQRAAQAFRARRELPRTVRTPSHTDRHGNLLEMLGCSPVWVSAHTHDPVSSPGCGGMGTRVFPPTTAPRPRAGC